MRSFYIFVLCLILTACSDKKNTEKINYLPTSNGALKELAVVVDNALWEGEVGEQIRAIFAAPITGLPVDEPLFSLKQIPPQTFRDEATHGRSILKVEQLNVAAKTTIFNNRFAKPQTIAVVAAATDQELIDQLKANAPKLLNAINKEEVKEKQRRINLSLLEDAQMETALGFKINIPSIYRIAKAEKDFFWLRKNLSSSKTIELMVYDIPLSEISKDNNTIVDIINKRNKITKTKIPGEDGIYMTVDDAYAPALFHTIIDNKPAYEVRGLWRMQGFTMAGPFITYLIEDTINNRYLVADGYIYAPSLDKSDYILELEAIIKSITIK